MNWRRNVRPAVIVGLFGFPALSSGSVISFTGPAARSSLASRNPPGRAKSTNASVRAGDGLANGGTLRNSRPNVGWYPPCGASAPKASPGRLPTEMAVAATPAPTPWRNRRRLMGQPARARQVLFHGFPRLSGPLSALFAPEVISGRDRLKLRTQIDRERGRGHR